MCAQGGTHASVALFPLFRLHFAAAGKSFFGLYAAFRAVRDGRTVVLNSFSAGCIMFKAGKAIQLPTADLTCCAELNDASTLYICDGLPAVPRKRAFRLIIASGNSLSDWADYLTEPKTCLVALPGWSDEEMWALHAACFSKQPRAGVAERIRKWGNNPRHVFSKGDEGWWQDLLEAAAWSLHWPDAAATVSSMMRTPHEVTGLIDFSRSELGYHRMMTLVPKGLLPGSALEPSDPRYYDIGGFDLASPYARDKCIGLAGALEARPEALPRARSDARPQAEAAGTA